MTRTTSPLPSRNRRPIRPCTVIVLLGFALAAGGTAARSQPAVPAIPGTETVSLSYSYRHFDGVTLDTVVLTAKSVRLVTDTFGAWAPYDDAAGITGLVLRHRRLKDVFVTITPFSGAGPGESDETWQEYLDTIAKRLGAGTVIEDRGESGTPGGTAAFASWPTREALLVRPALPPAVPARTERHVAAANGSHGILVILAGPSDDAEAATRDFRFLLARLERQ